MTRTQKRKKLNRKKMIKKIIRNIAYLIIGFVAVIYYTLKAINNLTTKLFNKLPRLAKVGVVYSMIILSVIAIINISTSQAKVIDNQIEEKLVVVAFEEMQEENVVEEIEEEKVISFENENETNIYNTSIEKGLTHEQALLVISISRHETGNWKSNAFVNCHNFGGIMTNNATKIKCYETYQEGLDDFVRILKSYYFDLGLTSVEQIGAKYCPVGAENDPNGLNKYWVGGVSSFYNNYLKNYSK